MIEQHVSGTVYGAILNDAASLAAIGDLEAPPYKGAPKAPALYIKPTNTLLASGECVSLPAGEKAVEVAATVGLVIGRTVACTEPSRALDHVAGLVLAADLSLPHASYYRPAIREKCFDGALPIGDVRPYVDIAGLTLVTSIDGEIIDRRTFNDLIRTPAQLLAEVSGWMALSAGDVLLVGIRYQAPQARVGQSVQIRAEGLGCVHFTLAEGASA